MTFSITSVPSDCSLNSFSSLSPEMESVPSEERIDCDYVVAPTPHIRTAAMFSGDSTHKTERVASFRFSSLENFRNLVLNDEELKNQLDSFLPVTDDFSDLGEEEWNNLLRIYKTMSRSPAQSSEEYASGIFNI